MAKGNRKTFTVCVVREKISHTNTIDGGRRIRRVDAIEERRGSRGV